MVDIADRFFAPTEVADLNQQSSANQDDYFFNFWTLKEAYIKARGMGLSIPLDKFAFTLGPPTSILCDPSLGDNSQEWTFWLFKPGQGHKTALAVRKNPSERYSLNIRKVIPLAASHSLDCEFLSRPYDPS